MNHLRETSPVSDAFSTDTNQKATLKKSAAKTYNNCKVGYVPVHQQNLVANVQQGRKTFAFWILVFVLFVLAVGNLVITIIIVSVLRLGKGMESLEVISEESAVKFMGDTDLGHVYKRDGKIEGYHEVPIDFTADNGTVLINLGQKYVRPLVKLKLERNGTFVKNTEEFEVKNNDGEIIYSTQLPRMHNLRNVKNIATKVVEVNRITSPVDVNLKIESRTVSLKGAEGTKIEGKQILWNSDQDVYLKSVNGSIRLSGKDGIFIDIEKIPIAIPKYSSYNRAEYKVCVCMPQGKLFRVPVPTNRNSTVYCNQINLTPQHNPCM